MDVVQRKPVVYTSEEFILLDRGTDDSNIMRYAVGRTDPYNWQFGEFYAKKYFDVYEDALKYFNSLV
jgi:hypothetical protein